VEAIRRHESRRQELIRSPHARAAVVTAAVFVLVFLVSLGSSRSLAEVRGPGRVLDAPSIVGDLSVVVALLAVVVLAGVAFTLFQGARRRRRKDEFAWVLERPPVPLWQQVLLLSLLLVPAGLIVGAVVAGREAHRQGVTTAVSPPALTGPVHPSPPLPTATPEPAATTAHWWFWAAVVLAGLAIASVAFVRRRVGRTALEAPPRIESDELKAALDESLDELEREPDPRRAVIRAYTGMERTLARQGLGRLPFEAPREYLARVLGTIRVSPTPGERLTGLYQRARFSEHRIDRRMKQEAITALATVRDELGRERQ
jgi:hypothetical protein